MAHTTNSNQFIVCPTCQGRGKNNFGFNCPYCSGMGTGTFFHGRFFYWGPKLGRAVIELDHLRKKFQLSINIIAFTIGFIGLISLGVWVYITSEFTVRLGAFAFWRETHILILIFWISLIADMFMWYRLSERIRKAARIKQIPYEDRYRKNKLPNNWDDLRHLKNSMKIDTSTGYNNDGLMVVEKAFLFAAKLNKKEVEPIHIFYTLLGDKQVAALFTRLNMDIKSIVDKLNKYIGKPEKEKTRTEISTEVKEILIEAYLDANNLGQGTVSGVNMIIPAIEKDKMLEEILFDIEIDKEKIYNVILWFYINEKQIENYKRYRKMARFKPGSNMDRAYTSVATPTLNHFAYDLTIAAKWGKLDFCVAREKEIDSIFQAMESGHYGVLLTGEIGTGKKTIVDGLAQRMVKEEVPEFLRDKRLIELDATRLISGVNPAQAEGRMLLIIDEVARAGNIILFIKNLENLIGITSGEEESLDLADVLASAIERKSLYCFGSATNENFSKYVEDTSLGNAMFKVDVNEPQGSQAIQIIESKIGYYEGKYHVYFSYNAIEEVIKMTNKYIHDRFLPEKALTALESVAVKVQKKKGKESLVTKADIAEVLSEITKIPLTKISESESKTLLNLENRIHERMVNQEEAVKMVAASLRRARTQMREGKRPIANFLFMGPTGVGKTELAKTVAEVYFGSEDYMIRMDMSEYQHPDSIKKMIGQVDKPGHLTEAVRHNPFSLLLLDEFEKAHPDILNLFLQVMEDGRLTDGEGRTVDFTNSVVIATSNAAALFIQEQIASGAKVKDIKDVLINEHLNKVLRPELINRFDGVIVFEPLSMENVVEIAKLMLGHIGKMLEKKGIEFEFSEEGARKLAEKGYDPTFGARPLRRLLQEKVEDEIANKILSGDLLRRDKVYIDVDAKVSIEKAKKL